MSMQWAVQMKGPQNYPLKWLKNMCTFLLFIMKLFKYTKNIERIVEGTP